MGNLFLQEETTLQKQKSKQIDVFFFTKSESGKKLSEFILTSAILPVEKSPRWESFCFFREPALSNVERYLRQLYVVYYENTVNRTRVYCIPLISTSVKCTSVINSTWQLYSKPDKYRWQKSVAVVLLRCGCLFRTPSNEALI